MRPELVQPPRGPLPVRLHGLCVCRLGDACVTGWSQWVLARPMGACGSARPQAVQADLWPPARDRELALTWQDAKSNKEIELSVISGRRN